jgi:hypothetical protein
LGRRPLGFTEHYYTEWDDGLGKEKISLFLLVSVANTQIPAADIAKEAFQLLQDHFLDDLAGDPYDRFENALREINHMAIEKEKELEVKFLPNMHVIIGVIQRDLLFLSQRGEAGGFLLRKRHVSSITDGLFDEKNKEDLFQNIASGVLEVGDNLLFVTGPLVQYVTPNDLAKIFSEQTLVEATKELSSLLKNDIEEQLALLAFEIMEKTEEVAPVLVKMGDEEVEEKQTTMNGEEVEDLPKSPRKAQIEKAAALLRGFVAQKDRLAFLDKVRSWPKKQLLVAIAVVLVVVVGGVYALFLTLSEQNKINAMQAKLDNAQSDIAAAETKGAFDKAEASVLLNSAEDLAVEVVNSGYLGSAASDLLDQISADRDDLDIVHRIESKDLKLVADLSDKLASGEKLEGIEPSDDRLVVYTAHNAYQILTDKAQDADVLDATDTVTAARSFPDYNTILMNTAAGKMIEYTDGNAQFADTADVQWHSGVDMATYSNKVYLLDAISKQIWKYQRGNSGYSGASAYFSAAPDDLANAVSLAVDGKVWVLLKDGTLLQYFAGDPVKYTIKKAPLASFQGAVRVYTDIDMTQLYILDAVAKRIFVYDKSQKTDDLTYSSQYALDALPGTLTDMMIDKSNHMVYVTTDTGLYQMTFTADL